MNEYAIYLRKSRADLEAEARGEGETLERHRTALRALAKRRGLRVVQEYAEIVTGDSIAARPQMQLLLDDVKKGRFAGVIVNDVDRLGRGDSIDQELIKWAFVAGRCIIITPTRDINPASPSDQDMLDFSMFFARFEYRKIAQRLMQGRTRSAMSGNFISPRVPFGYKKVVEGKKITLVPDADTAPIVKMIFDWYASGVCGYKAIAERLNDMGIKTYRGYDFDRATVKAMLINPVYIGRIAWGRTTTVPAIEDGHRLKRHIKSDPAITEDAHPAIVSREVFDRVQEMFRQSRHATPKRDGLKLQNPLAGLIYCAECGHALQLRGGNKSHNNDRILTCLTHGCPTRGTYRHIIVDAVLEIVRGWCVEYRQPPEERPDRSEEVQALKKQEATLRAQIEKAQELVELGVYTPSEYLRRRDALQERIDAVQARLAQEATIATPEAINTLIGGVERVLDAYQLAETPEEQNALLKSIVARIEYKKTRVAVKGESLDALMEIKVFPKMGNIM